jgi:putative DNA primase/helicase
VSDKRVRIDATLPLHDKVDLAVAALVAANADRPDPTLLVRGNELARMTERGELERVDADSLRKLLSEAAQFEKPKAEGHQPIDPPRDVAQTIIAADSSSYGDLPRVDRVVDVPVLDSTGALVTDPGYHAASRLYYRPAEGLEGVKPPADIGVEEVEWATGLLLDDLLGDFGFDDDASKAHALALLLLPFVREYIGDGSTPLHVALAPNFGSGKTWLAQACLMPGCGLVAATPNTSSDEEWRKKITATLLAGRPAVLLDNLSGVLDTGAFAAALTSGTWTDRVLGESREVHLPIRNIWVATGNNLGLSPELTRRTVASFLDPGSVRPADRDREAFRHPNLLQWAEDNRRELVEAALTLIEHWRLGAVEVVEGGYVFVRGDGGPQTSQKTKGSYERWAGVVGGVLEAAGVEGFLGNEDRLAAEADDETHDAMVFLSAIHAQPEQPYTAAELVDLATFTGPLKDDLPVDLAGLSTERLSKAMPKWLREYKGREVGGYRLVNDGGSGKGGRRRWSVQQRSS